MNEQLSWRIYYGDRSAFSSADGSPLSAPAWDVQAIIQKHIESGRYITCLYDYYIYRGDRWFGVDAAGLVDYLLHIDFLNVGKDGRKTIWREDGWTSVDAYDFILAVAESGLAKIGRMICKEDFSAIHRLAEADDDFPKRTAYRTEEARWAKP